VSKKCFNNFGTLETKNSNSSMTYFFKHLLRSKYYILTQCVKQKFRIIIIFELRIKEASCKKVKQVTQQQWYFLDIIFHYVLPVKLKSSALTKVAFEKFRDKYYYCWVQIFHECRISTETAAEAVTTFLVG